MLGQRDNCKEKEKKMDLFLTMFAGINYKCVRDLNGNKIKTGKHTNTKRKHGWVLFYSPNGNL